MQTRDLLFSTVSINIVPLRIIHAQTLPIGKPEDSLSYSHDSKVACAIQLLQSECCQLRFCMKYQSL